MGATHRSHGSMIKLCCRVRYSHPMGSDLSRFDWTGSYGYGNLIHRWLRKGDHSTPFIAKTLDQLDSITA